MPDTISFSRAEVASYFAHRLPSLKQQGDEWRCPCPLHEGERDSFAINSSTGKWRCHSKCDTGGDILEFEMRMQDLDFKDAIRAVDEIVGRKLKQAPRIVETYPYTDADGKLLFEVVRREPKDFRQRQPDGNGGWEWNIKGVSRVPYRLPAVIDAPEVFLVEGEKDVHAIEKLGLVASTVPGGAGKWLAQYAPYFAGKVVYVIPDDDAVGRRHAAEQCAGLSGISSVVKLVEIGAKDISEWRGSAEDLLLLADAAPEWQPEAAPEVQSTHATESLKPQELAASIMAAVPLLADMNDNLWRYRDNAWEMITQAVAESMAFQYDHPETSTDRRRREAIKAIKVTTQIGSIMTSKLADNEVPVRNGVLNLQTSRLRPHDQKDRVQTIIPWDFDPRAKCPVWERCIDFWFRNDAESELKTRIFKMYMGYLLFQHARFKKALVLLGKRDTGKSLALGIMIDLVGAENTCSIGVSEMGDPRKLAPIRGKLLNAIPDMSRDAMIEDGGFKKIVSTGDLIQIDPKYKDTQLIEPIAKHVFATNTMPSVQDESDATYSRLLILQFRNVVPAAMQDRDLKEKLRAEMPGILAWAAHGAAMLVASGGQFPDLAERDAAIDESLRDSNPFLDFVSDEMEEDEDGEITNTDLLKRFRAWYSGPSVSDQKIGRWRKQAGLETGVARNQRGAPTRVVKGYRWAPSHIVNW